MVAIPGKTLRDVTLILRPFDVDRDAPEWFIAMQEPDMHRWTGNQVPDSLANVRELLLGYIAHPDIIAWCIRDGRSDQMVGTYWIAIPVTCEEKCMSSDAQRIAKPFWRTGRTMAARRLVYRYAFEELAVDEMHAGAWEQNVNSVQSMERAGFELVEVKLRYNPKYKEAMNERHYVLTRQNWLKLYRI